MRMFIYLRIPVPDLSPTHCTEGHAGVPGLHVSGGRRLWEARPGPSRPPPGHVRLGRRSLRHSIYQLLVVTVVAVAAIGHRSGRVGGRPARVHAHPAGAEAHQGGSR